MHRLAHEDPPHVRPPLAIDRRVWIAFVVRKLMMNPVRCHPENRSAFECQRRTPGQEVFHPLRRPVSAMRQQTVIAHPDTEAARYPPQENGGEKSRPGKEK